MHIEHVWDVLKVSRASSERLMDIQFMFYAQGVRLSWLMAMKALPSSSKCSEDWKLAGNSKWIDFRLF